MQIDRQGKTENGRVVFCFALAAFLLQLALAAVTEKYPYDASCFSAWAMHMAEVGPGNFYGQDYFCDYPPGYMLLLWLPGLLLRIPSFPAKLQQIVLAFWPALAGVGITMLVYRIGCRYAAPQVAKRVALFAAFCPAILYDTGVWGQIDSVFALLILCCFALLEEKRYLPGAVFYGLALAVKPQALLVGPVLAVCFLWPVIFSKERAAALRQLALGVGAALLPPVLCGLPFWGIRGVWAGLWNKYGTTTASYLYGTINACNLMAFLGGEWKADTQPIAWLGSFALPTWRQLGTALLLALTVWMLCWAWRAQKAGRFSPLLTAAVYGIGVFTVGHCMHERYLIFAVVVLLGAAARYGDKRLLSLAGGFSLTSLLNMALVYGMVGTEHEYLDDAASSYMQRWTGLGEVALFALLALAAWRMTVGAQSPANGVPEKESGPAHSIRKGSTGTVHNTKNGAKDSPADDAWTKPAPLNEAAVSPLRLTAKPAAQPVWQKRERLFLLGLTAAVAVISFVYLGDMTAPQTCLDTNGTTETFTLTPEGQAAEIWVYTGISSDNAGSLTVTAQDGSLTAQHALDWGACFNWYPFAADGSPTYTFTLDDGQIFEVAFRDAQGKLLAAGCDTDAAAATIDEQSAVPAALSQLNTFYFDEIYHARTGYELLHGMTVYETTHPPLGKDFIALGIAIFGMTGFGWRFFGTLFGVLLVPLVYCFVRRLTRKPAWAAFAGVLLGLDFMRFAQSRLATIDTYAVFFILLAVDCMVWYCQRVLTDGVKGALLPMLCGGVAFGLGCASKWTGIYAGAGLAVLYFGVLAVRRRQLCEEDAAKGASRFARELGLAMGGGVLCFVVLPLGIYLLSYAPYWLRDHSFGLRAWWDCQTYMYWYHSTLEATHPFSSNWYSWLLNLRPVWYYSNGHLAAGLYGSIAGFLSPVVAIAGLAAWLRTAQRQLVGEGGRAGGVLIVALLSSLLPWVMVTRCTFLYHYFPCVPFLIAALALELSRWSEKAPQHARRTAIGILAAAGILFVWFYPVLSGLPVNGVWAASLQWLESWGFYIVV